MRRITLCIVAALIATISFAQHDGAQQRQRREFNPEEMAVWQTNRLQQTLQLDSVQYQAIFLMNYADALTMQDSMKARMERAEKMRAEGKRPERPTDEQMKAREDIRKEREKLRNEQMKQILTPEQYEKYLKDMEAQKERMRRGPANRGGHPQGRMPRQ
jgi:Spy/CpxP family protein refolding chaperone